MTHQERVLYWIEKKDWSQMVCACEKAIEDLLEQAHYQTDIKEYHLVRETFKQIDWYLNHLIIHKEVTKATQC